MAHPLVLVLGGTRSGKSTFGLSRAAALANGLPVAFLATAVTSGEDDAELAVRIDGHRRARPASWPTIEVGTDLPAALAAAGADRPILLDGLTLWLSALVDTQVGGSDHSSVGDGSTSRTLDIEAMLDGPIAAGVEAIDAHLAPVVAVSDEIGLGMVPMDGLARSFRDLQGIVHQRLATRADEVVLVVAGLPLTLKRS
jgi:adenosyl cobinamide kinase/adenosyl cobinamide phosphate guanylyltransferase